MAAPLSPPVISSNVMEPDVPLAGSGVGDLLAEIKRDTDVEMCQAMEWVEKEEAITHAITDQWAEEMLMAEVVILDAQESYVPSESNN